jgi:undecaprenyl-diphosphatase
LRWTERAHRFLAARLDRSSELGLRLTVNLVLFAGAIWLFGGLLDAVLDNATLVAWDHAVNGWFHVRANPVALHTFAVLTMIGTPGAWIVVAAVALWLAVRRDWLLFWAWVTINLGGGVVQYALKVSVHRRRPLDAAAFLHDRSYSFPSGHTMDATITYTLLAFVVATVFELPAHRRAPLYVAAAALVVLVGFSRIYLGVHYPSDVFGGFAAGVAWLTAGLATLHVVRTRRGAGRSQD